MAPTHLNQVEGSFFVKLSMVISNPVTHNKCVAIINSNDGSGSPSLALITLGILIIK